MMHTSCYGPALYERDRHFANLTADAARRVHASSLATAEGRPREQQSTARRGSGRGGRGEEGERQKGGGNCLEVEHAIAVEIDPAEYFLQLFSHAVGPIPHPARLCTAGPFSLRTRFVPLGRNASSLYQVRPRDYIWSQDVLSLHHEVFRSVQSEC